MRFPFANWWRRATSIFRGRQPASDTIQRPSKRQKRKRGSADAKERTPLTLSSLLPWHQVAEIVANIARFVALGSEWPFDQSQDWWRAGELILLARGHEGITWRSGHELASIDEVRHHLCAMSLVCRSWRAPAQSLLGRTLILAGGEADKVVPVELGKHLTTLLLAKKALHSRPFYADGQLDAVLKTLRSAERVKTLVFEAVLYWRRGALLPSIDLPMSFDALENLVVFRAGPDGLDASAYRCYVLSIVYAARQLRRLALDGCWLNFVNIPLDAVKVSSNLRTLVLDDLLCSRAWFFDFLQGLSPQLEELYLSVISWYPPDGDPAADDDWLEVLTMPRVTRLTILEKQRQAPELQLRMFPACRTLTLDGTDEALLMTVPASGVCDLRMDRDLHFGRKADMTPLIRFAMAWDGRSQDSSLRLRLRCSGPQPATMFLEELQEVCQTRQIALLQCDGQPLAIRAPNPVPRRASRVHAMKRKHERAVG